MPRSQQGSLRIEDRADGLTWVLRYHATRSDGKRVERTMPAGLVEDIGSSRADALREIERQKLRETINQFQPFPGKPRTYGQLSQHYIENELRIDQSESARPKEFPTLETYERYLANYIMPRWRKVPATAVEPLDVEQWFRELRRGNPQIGTKPLADPTIDKIRRIMNWCSNTGNVAVFFHRNRKEIR